MSTQNAVIASTVGLHARPAALFVALVKETGHKVTVGIPDGKTVNAASMLGVMSLGAKCGQEVVVTVEGDDDESVVKQLVEFLEINHDTPEE